MMTSRTTTRGDSGPNMPDGLRFGVNPIMLLRSEKRVDCYKSNIAGLYECLPECVIVISGRKSISLSLFSLRA